MAETPHVVIVGGGFAGLAVAKGLRKAPVRTTLIDRSNHHLFQPLLYQVATSALSAPDIAAPIRKLVRSLPNNEVVMAHVEHLDVEERTVQLADGDTFSYDYLCLACGMTNSYFGNDRWEAHAPGLKTLTDALTIRARVLQAFEAAERCRDPERRRALTTFAVIGGGPTGVEMAGALAEIGKWTLARDFDRIKPAEETRVILIEGGERVLAGFHEESSAKAAKALEALGVELRFGKFVTDVDEAGVHLGDELVRAGTVVWGAGVKASPLTAELPGERDRAGRVLVEEDLTLPGHPEVFVLGDLIKREQDGKPLPGVAQLALQSGAYAARTITLRTTGREDRVEPFRFKDKGSMATIGRNKAVAEVGGSRFSGVLAWLLWVFVHVLFLVDFRNRFSVLFEWAYSYLTWRRSARVILAPAPARAELAEGVPEARPRRSEPHVEVPAAAAGE